MPTYTYKCKECNHQFDIRQKISEDKLTDCPECKKVALEKIITGGTGFQLKGSGWFGKGGSKGGY
jgi:putative FmdB family regulatory protein